MLATVDVIGGTGQGGVDHEVHGQGGDIPRLDHAMDGQRVAELLTPLLRSIKKPRGSDASRPKRPARDSADASQRGQIEMRV